jgi:predicted 3-demethylubiquinone-9 3-methyltransferase (glyoxalase superfamily)
MAQITNQKIKPFLWFDKQAEEAMQFYVDVFNSSPHSENISKIISIARYEKGMAVPQSTEMEGKVITAVFELNGQTFMCLDGGPLFKFNESFSLYVECQDQNEVDYFWEEFTSGGGEESMCGWLKDKFGLSWQIIPKRLGELAGDKDREKAQRVIDAMLKMKKIVVADLERAAAEAD